MADVPEIAEGPEAAACSGQRRSCMNHRAKAIRLSFFLHAALMLTALVPGRPAVAVKQPLVIDCTVETVEALMEKQTEPDRPIPAAGKAAVEPAVPVYRHENKPDGASCGRADAHHQQNPQPENRPAGPTQGADQNKPASSEVEQEAAEPSGAAPATSLSSTAPAGAGKDGAVVQSAAPAAGMDDNQAQGRGAADHEADGPGEQEKRYLQNNFDYIRNLIMRNLSFPAAARKLGWRGKIVVSFIIREDGNVEEIHIVSGSGHEVLDTNVVAAIRRTAPFPEPPGKAQLILPVVYRLQ